MQDLDAILQRLGGFGKFQGLTFLYIGLICMRGAWQMLAISFLASVPDHNCKLQDGEEPYRSVNDAGEFVIDSCKQYVNVSVNNDTVKCKHGWEYGSTGSIVNDWDIVCDKSYLIDLSTFVFMAGVMFGGLFLSPVADHLGRKWIIISGILLQGIIGTITAFVNSITAFMALRFFLGALNQVVALVAYVSLTETFPPSHRTRPGIALQLFWALGICLLALFAWLLPNWRHLQLAISVPNVLAICLIFVFHESIPWLVMKGKTSEAQKAIERIAKTNKVPVPQYDPSISNVTSTQTADEEEMGSKTPEVETETVFTHTTAKSNKNKVLRKPVERVYTVIDLFRSPRICLYTILMFLIWLINSLDYYGISLSISSLHGNVYINFFISGLVEVPAYLVVMFALDVFGRRRPLTLFAFLSGVANLVTAFLPEETEDGTDLRVLITVMGMIGKFAITGSFCTVFLFAAEIFPTVLRNTAVGVVSLGDGVGGVSAPLILLTASQRPELPRAIFGCLAIFAAFAVILLPETHNRPLMETIEDIENSENQSLGERVKDFFRCKRSVKSYHMST